jgi:hypothetical protein
MNFQMAEEGREAWGVLIAGPKLLAVARESEAKVGILKFSPVLPQKGGALCLHLGDRYDSHRISSYKDC